MHRPETKIKGSGEFMPQIKSMRNKLSLPLHMRTETDPVSETLCSLAFLGYWMMDSVQKPNNSEYRNNFQCFSLNHIML
jgi:hypothetical protein